MKLIYKPDGWRPNPGILLIVILVGWIVASAVFAQLQQSGGSAAVTVTSGTITAVTSITNALPAGTNVIGHVITDSGTITAVTAITNALPIGTNILGVLRTIPGPCTTTSFVNFSTVGVATGAGTSVTSTTSCIVLAYANNITNSAVTLRLADKTGTPIIWLGGNADFSIPANSNIHIPIEGVTFASGITAIAGTTAAINLFLSTLQ